MVHRHAVALAACLLCAHLPLHAQEIDFDQPAQPLSAAITQLGKRSGLSIVVDMALVSGYRAQALSGRHTPQAALVLLLHGTGLRGRFDGSIVTIQRDDGAAGEGGRHPAQSHGNSLPTVVVTGKRDAREQAYETPGSVSVVTREDIDRLPPRNTADVLLDVPGVYTSQTRQNPGVAVNIRGLQDFGRVNVMIDGARQNFQRSGHGANGQAYLDPELLAGVDVAKGPASTVGGAGMIGGSVNFRTLAAEDLIEEGQRYGGRVNATTGTNAYHFAGSVAGAWRPTDPFDLTVAVSRKNVGEFKRGNNGNGDSNNGFTHGTSLLSSQDQTSGLFKMAWRPAPGHEIRLGYVGLDASFTEGNSTTVSSGDVATRNRVRTDTVTANYDWQSGWRWLNLATSLYYTQTVNDQDRDATDSYGAFRLHYRTNTLGGTAQNTAYFGLPGVDAIVKVGGEFFHDWTDPQAQPSTTGQSLWFTGATPRGRRTVASAFGEASLLRGDWLELTGGLRYDWYGLQGDGQMYVGSIANAPGVRPSVTNLYTSFKVDRSDGALAPRLSLAIKPVEQVQFFASYGRGLRPPAITESLMWGMHTGNMFPYYPNPNLSEERASNWEAGANLRFDDLLAGGDKLRVKAAWFDTKVDNYIVQARIMSPISAGSGGLFGPFAFVNLKDPYRSKGIELQGDYDAGFAFGSVSYTRLLIDSGRGGYDPFPLGSLLGYPATTLGQPGGANLWYVMPPKVKLVLSGGVRLFQRKLTLGGRMRLTTPTRNDSGWTSGSNDNNRTTHVYDAWLSYQPTRQLTLRLSVENLRDTNYFEMNGGTYWVAPGRTTMATVSYKF
ncbi:MULTISPECIES: TonB-dependent hemoglobin/transferrin/lactoferrin family receptor [Cupriavidus]